jgi:hypothetical protein
MRTLHRRKDGTSSKEKEFVKAVVSLREFWADVKGFVAEFVPHHELSKAQGREFAALKSTDPATKKPTLRPRHARGVIDYLQRYTIKRGQKETQQEFFAQLGMTLLVVSLSLHIDDLQNLGSTPEEAEREKVRMKATLVAAGKPLLIREEHFYCSHDPERGQAAVQHTLQDIEDYLQSNGRWAASGAECSAERHKAWQEDEYYNGRGAAARGRLLWLHMWSDGCSADFKCAGLLLWLSMAARGMRYCWNWFASCHGKTDECDAGGGAFKRTLDGIELAGKGFFDGAKEIVQRSRECLTKPNANNNDPAEAWYWNASSERDGSGVYRRWYHHIPVRGPDKINRRIAHAAEGQNVSDEKTNLPFQIRRTGRVLTTGFDYHLYCANRSCYSCTECRAGNFSECLCSKADAEDAHNQWGGRGRSSHELREVIVEPRTIEKDQYSHVRLLEEGQLVFKDSSVGDVLAMESQSDSEPFWLVRVIAKHDRLDTQKQFEEWGASIKCAKGGKAVEVTKLMPSSAAAANTFCEDETGKRFFVPASLLRVGQLQLAKKIAKRRSTRSRAAVHSKSTGYYEQLSSEDRQVVGLASLSGR